MALHMLFTFSGRAEDQITTVKVSMQYLRKRCVCGRAVNLVGALRLGRKRSVPFRSITTRRCCGSARGVAGMLLLRTYCCVGSGMPPEAALGETFWSRVSLLLKILGVLLGPHLLAPPRPRPPPAPFGDRDRRDGGPGRTDVGKLSPARSM